MRFDGFLDDAPEDDASRSDLQVPLTVSTQIAGTAADVVQSLLQKALAEYHWRWDDDGYFYWRERRSHIPIPRGTREGEILQVLLNVDEGQWSDAVVVWKSAGTWLRKRSPKGEVPRIAESTLRDLINCSNPMLRGTGLEVERDKSWRLRLRRPAG